MSAIQLLYPWYKAFLAKRTCLNGGLQLLEVLGYCTNTSVQLFLARQAPIGLMPECFGTALRQCFCRIRTQFYAGVGHGGLRKQQKFWSNWKRAQQLHMIYRKQLQAGPTCEATLSTDEYVPVRAGIPMYTGKGAEAAGEFPGTRVERQCIRRPGTVVAPREQIMEAGRGGVGSEQGQPSAGVECRMSDVQWGTMRAQKDWVTADAAAAMSSQ
ncbi:hypothetical protein C8R45DRAFT_926883 [Mycena sanguinolenta]|nr:hypothetical protein C8R45DRAFT_926883 [Mycena sanguinolenta]